MDRPGPHTAIDGAGALRAVVLVDQAPLGRTARGNAATYTKAWNRIRALFAGEPEAKRRGLTPAHFSFNVAETKGRAVAGVPRAGRCEACAGEGYETIEMQFLADVALLCTVCQGKRFRPEVLAVKHRGLDVSEVLGLTVDEVIARFGARSEGADYEPAVVHALAPVARVGLGYLPLGQPLSTLSGGEAQRLKLARALSEPARGTLFVLDEPSAGLHAEDVRHVTGALHALVEQGASVLVVEHDLDVIAAADWVIDLGPGGGPAGGRVVAEGTPEAIVRSGSKTGKALGEHARPGRDAARRVRKSPDAAPVDAIQVENAREHNLKRVTCTIPHGALTVVTGPSGSGKSSLAFDVVFAEGQRRFMETLSPYARQFLPTLPRPDVDSVTGVPPSIALEQRTSRAGANSSVATVTEIAHYLRLLYAKLGDVHCPACDTLVAPAHADEIYARIRDANARGHVTLFAPAVQARKGTYLDVFTMASREGLTHARVDGDIVAIEPPPRLAKTKEHTIDLLVFEGPVQALDRSTFDRALALGHGAIRLRAAAGKRRAGAEAETIHSTARACPACGIGVPEMDPRWFSFNTSQGRCTRCEGTGARGGAEESASEPGATVVPCEECDGSRLASLPRRVRLFGETYPGFLKRDVRSAAAAVLGWRFEGSRAELAKAAHAELRRRLSFVEDVGLGYLSLERAAATLSGGEMQRLRLSAQLGSGLTGALYVLDEPTIGLHPRDTQALLGNLRALVATGSTVLVVEHDAETIRAADHVLDLGPEGGRNGGHIVSQGTAREVLSDPRSPTAQALAELGRGVRVTRDEPACFLELTGARAHNLRSVTFRVPVGRMVVVAGVSGSGKSTLVRTIFLPALRRALGLVAPEPGPFDQLRTVGPAGKKPRKGEVAGVRRALAVDQAPIGRTPRSVPATFLGIWDEIRRLFARLPESQMRGYTPARFSFNTPSGGRCPTCEGQGAIVSEMAFLPDVVSPCDACGGARFEPATLDVRYAGQTIGDVLRLSAEDAAQLFAAHPKIARPLETLRDLGVGYVQLGQGSNTLSGGEAQRLKLAAELTGGTGHEPTLYVLDEPTTGLHLRDVRKLLTVLDRLVERGDTLVVVEHHPDVIAAADWVIELGPEAGAAGG